MNEGVVLGFSGGMDSRTAAMRLMQKGYRVVALTIDTIGDSDMMLNAQNSASELGIEWMSYDARERFRCEIIDYFCTEYQRGRTPAPCTRCNPQIKWRILCSVADELGITKVATGHYFNVVQRNGFYYVAMGRDKIKDQSYYLWGLSQATLARIITPMGDAIKHEIKEGFTDKRESMGICFLRGKHYGEFLKEMGYTPIAGEVVDCNGKICGTHTGIANYTIGQKRGKGIPDGGYVTAIDAKHNRLIIGTKEDLYKHELQIEECVVVDREELLTANDITIKIRGFGVNPQLPVKVEANGNGYRVTTRDSMLAPANGQPLVFYRDNLVIGGGIVVENI